MIEYLLNAIKSDLTHLSEVAEALRLPESFAKRILEIGKDTISFEQEKGFKRLKNRIEKRRETKFKTNLFEVPTNWVIKYPHQAIMSNGLPKPLPKLYAC